MMTLPWCLLCSVRYDRNMAVAMNLFRVVLAFLLLVIVLFLSPFLLALSLCFRIYRHTLLFFIGRRTHNTAIPMVGDDAIWRQDSSQNRAIISGLMIMEGDPDMTAITELFEKRVVFLRRPDGTLRYPKMSYYPSQMMHRYIWLPEKNFDCKNHITLAQIDPVISMAELHKLVGEYCSENLPADKAAWQVTIIPLNMTDPQLGYAALFRVHHCIGDGISIVRIILQTLMDGANQNKALPQRFGSKGRLRRTVEAFFEWPLLLTERIFWPSDENMIHNSKTELSGKKLVSWSDGISLPLIKEIKNATDSTVNDVLVACLSQAFRRYFVSSQSNPPNQMVCYLPVDLRPPTEHLILENQFAIVYLTLPVGIEDPLDCLQAVKSHMQRIKTSPEPLINMLAVKYIMSRFPNWFTAKLFDMISSKCSLVFSNVPGFQCPLRFASSNIKMMTFWPPQRNNVPMGISIFSYNGEIRFGVIVDDAVMKNPNILCHLFTEEVNHFAKILNVC